ncbi:MAG: hypothetical protein WC974_07690 [Thermoplasmata archaeon]
MKKCIAASSKSGTLTYEEDSLLKMAITVSILGTIIKSSSLPPGNVLPTINVISIIILKDLGVVSRQY